MKGPMLGPSLRSLAATVAAVALAGEVLFFLAHLRATGSLRTVVWLLLAYLTDWSNLLVAAVCAN
ncbi:hypothetical protein [Sphingomonas guangdongensis]|uniref:hypothetical protein n=1 Tax=Sphingomonas guangdongensis TaxID=1141890 RepID=UPI0011818349|nr:hypothetical protein [Sphingomonas guangdongensis]